METLQGNLIGMVCRGEKGTEMGKTEVPMRQKYSVILCISELITLQCFSMQITPLTHPV